MVRTALLCAGLAIAMFGGASSARAVTFNLINSGGAEAGTNARNGFDIATRYWSSVLTDNATINLNIGFQALGGNILGQTSSNSKYIAVQSEYAALSADRTSALDVTAVAGLRPLGTSQSGLGSISPIVNAYSSAAKVRYSDAATRLDNDGSTNNVALAITSANAKALGLTQDVNGQAINYSAIDGGVTFSSDFGFDFNPTDGITSGLYDFVGVAIHEIGHALGFSSGVDSYDYYTGNGPGGNLATGALDKSAVGSSLDLFRYSAPGSLDWSTSADTKYFSIDGGATQVFGNSAFSLGYYNGDGHQASHWIDAANDSQSLGILDPTAGAGQMLSVTALDLSAFDAIGWNLSFDTLANPTYRYSTADAYSAFSATPDVATWGEMLVGFGALGGIARRRRASARAA